MVKVKNKKNFGLADKLHTKKAQVKFKKQLNPFEVHINKEKFKILGKKTKNDRGLPGVSRAKAMKRRKNTLGYELKLFKKSNTFLDKRIGEKNSAISEEDKMIARFTAEKIQQHKFKSGKQSIYNLAEDEILTHRGQTLEEIEKFDDPRSDDEDDDEYLQQKKYGNLQNDFVADANFGGGVLSRSDHIDGAKSRKDLIEQLIIESKKRKLEKQKLKEETLDLTEKLDSEWKDLHPIVSKDFNKEVESKTEKPSLIDKLLNEHNKKNEEYDKTMRELKFEPRGTPSDRLKGEDEIAKQEKEKLEKLEKDRLARMRGTAVNEFPTKSKHRSADDLDDGFQFDDSPEIMIAYNKDGKLLVPLNDTTKNDEEVEEDESSNDDNEEESNDESGNESDDSLNDLRKLENSSDEDDGELKAKVVDKSITRDLQQTMNRKRNVSHSSESEQTKKTKLITESNQHQSCQVQIDNADDNIKKDLQSRKLMMEKAAKELPFTYVMPNSYEELIVILENQPPDYQHVIIERLIKCNHPSLGEGNKEKLGNLFAYLLQHLNDLFSAENITNQEELINAFKCFDSLICHYYNIAQMDPLNAKNCIIEVVKEKYEDFKKYPKRFPGLDTLIFFKLVSVLFSTSDMKHPVVTPCVYFMANLLTTCRIRSSIDLAKGLFIVTLVLEYTSFSKRIMPAALNFIGGVLSLFVPTHLRKEIIVIPPFKLMGNPFSLIFNEKFDKSISIDGLMPIQYLLNENSSEEFKVHILINTLNIFTAFCNQSTEFHAQKILFKYHIDIINLLSRQKYPKLIKNHINSVKTKVMESFENKSLQRLVEDNKLPKMFKTYEPSFETDFSGKKKKVMSKEKAEHEKLLYKHKKEMKAALREIRRDKSYISSVKIKERLKSDDIRKQKVKRIYSEASLQQGELNALQRGKKKK
ncbi:nucleolar protein 14 homolog l(3)07882 [Arctopsyche grandis]|uniref:nucleolar protein 14 homolog l(3)07882 n=1 Tax=Arctopsyche grandis TaxID=121162 RepID=UPI00406D9735